MRPIPIINFCPLKENGIQYIIQRENPQQILKGQPINLKIRGYLNMKFRFIMERRSNHLMTASVPDKMIKIIFIYHPLSNIRLILKRVKIIHK